MRAAVLDLGSNSFHVLVADLDGASVAPVLREREMLHLGRAVARHGRVPDEEAQAAVDTVAHLTELARRAGATTVQAVATAALRDASNGPQVLDRLRDVAGEPIRVLDGSEEARLAYLGVRASVAVSAEPVLVLDLGGGSLELAVGVGDQVRWSTSTPLGASRLSADIVDDPPSPGDLAWLREQVDANIDPVVEVVQAHDPATCVAVGGTVRALGRLAAAGHARWLPATVNQLTLPTTELAALRDRLTGVDLTRRRKVPGMKSRRADHVHVAASVLTRTLERLHVRELTVSDWGLREGLLLDAVGSFRPPVATALRAGEVARLRRSLRADTDPHSDHVAELAGQLFDGTGDLHGLGRLDRELLVLAARLHQVGGALALRRQHVHGAYLIENAELRGFSPIEVAILSTLVRFHPSRGISTSFPAFASLTAADRHRTERLLPLLQVADGLDRAHDQAVTQVQVRPDRGRVELWLDGGGLHVTAAELTRRTRLFEEVYAVEVDVEDRAVA